MKVIRIGKNHTFDYSPEGLFFVNIAAWKILDCKTGDVVIRTPEVVAEVLKPQTIQMIKAKLELTNYFVSDHFEIVGISQEEYEKC